MRPNVRRVNTRPNAIRAGRVEHALTYYRVTSIREHGAEMDTVMSNFLTDLQHLCDRLNLNLAKLDRMAHLNYLHDTSLR